MIKNISVPYVPLLEGVPGKLFLTNNASAVLAYETGGDPIPASVAIQSGVLGFGKSSETIYQGRLALQFDAVSGKHELAYNATNWTADAADFFNLAIELRDIAFHKNGKTDVYDYTFNAAPNDSWGGSSVKFQVAALAQPRIASITPASIVCDGTPQTITINLKRRLHSSQNPTVTLAAAPGSAPVTLSPPQAIRNTAGQIIGWSMVVTASPQPAASVSLVMTASESVTFLKDELIVTETVTYLDAEDIGGFGVSQYNGTAGFSIVASSLEAGQGSDPYYGKLKSVKYVPSQGSQVYATRDAMFAGVLDTKIEVVNGTNSFGNVEIIAKPSGTNTRTVLGTCNKVLNGIVPNPNGSGDSVYKATHTLAFRTSAKPTSLAGADLSSHASWDIGYTCFSASGEVLSTNWFGSYVNGNLSLNYPAYLMYVVMGEDIYKWRPVNGWEGVTPTLKGEVTFYLSENWNAYKGMGGTVNAWDTLDYRLDAGSWVTTVDSTHPETRQNFSEDYGVKIATLNTASLANGNHTLEWRLNAAFMTQNGDTARSYVLPFTTNQGVAGGDPGHFTLGTTSPLQQLYQKGLDPVNRPTWDIQLYPHNSIAGPVSYSLLGAPSAMIATFAPPSGVFSSTSSNTLGTVLTVEADTVPSGSYPLSVVATCAGVARILELTLMVRPPSTGCVPAGTPIETIYGSVPVESIRYGDIVVSYNDTTLEKGTAVVMDVPTYENRQLYEIVTSDGTLVCSHDHRLAVMSQLGPSYLPARGVAVGDVVYNFKEGSLLPSDVIAVIPLERHEKVYHLTLKSDHVFIAGGFAAHNIKDPGPDIPVDPNDPRDWRYQL